MKESKCPVPREQQPTNEFIELSKSKIFSWPKTKKSLIASIEVKPILKNLIQIISIISVLALSGILLFQYNNF